MRKGVCGFLLASRYADTSQPVDSRRRAEGNFSIFTVPDILHLNTEVIAVLLLLQQKTSQSARQAMEKKIYYINQSQTLQHALAAFLSTRHHLFIVVNGYRETAGIITLEDVLEALIGSKIVDEFDTHDDLRVVADRHAKRNNSSPNSTDV